MLLDLLLWALWLQRWFGACRRVTWFYLGFLPGALVIFLCVISVRSGGCVWWV